MANQREFPAMTCGEACEAEQRAYRSAFSRWRAAFKYGRATMEGRPEEPEPCESVVLCSVCREPFTCGVRHGHPTDAEERHAAAILEPVTYAEPRDQNGRLSNMRELPERLPCERCWRAPSTQITRDRERVCIACQWKAPRP